MKKNIFFFLTAVLLSGSVPCFAKSLPALVPISNNLSDRLAADGDFQAYSISTYQFITKVKETQSGKLLVKYLNQTATTEEKEALALALNYNSEKELKLFLANTIRQKNVLDNRFMELNNFTEYQLDIRLARTKAVVSIMKPMVREEDCWDMFFALSTVWLNLCLLAPNWDECWIAAMAAISSATVGCLIIAD